MFSNNLADISSMCRCKCSECWSPRLRRISNHSRRREPGTGLFLRNRNSGRHLLTRFIIVSKKIYLKICGFSGTRWSRRRRELRKRSGKTWPFWPALRYVISFVWLWGWQYATSLIDWYLDWKYFSRVTELYNTGICATIYEFNIIDYNFDLWFFFFHLFNLKSKNQNYYRY